MINEKKVIITMIYSIKVLINYFFLFFLKIFFICSYVNILANKHKVLLVKHDRVAAPNKNNKRNCVLTFNKEKGM